MFALQADTWSFYRHQLQYCFIQIHPQGPLLLKPVVNKRTNNENFLPYWPILSYSKLSTVCKSHYFFYSQSLHRSATCTEHRTKQTAVQQKHTLSFHGEAGDKNHLIICEYKDTFNKGSDSIYPLISSALCIFNVINSLLHWWWEVTYGLQTDCWDKFLFSIRNIYQSYNRAHTGLWTFRQLYLLKQIHILV